MGHAPRSLAKAASEPIRSGLSPKMMSISAAVSAPTPNPSRSAGAVSAVSCVRCRSGVAISSARSTQRRARDRSVCFADAVGVSTDPGRRLAQRFSSSRSVRLRTASRREGGAWTTICFERDHRDRSRLNSGISGDLELTQSSRRPHRRSWGWLSTWPASTDRAAASASRVSHLPAARRRRRSARFTSATRCPSRRTARARPAP